MAQEVARGEIVIELDDRAAMAALKRVDDNFDRTMRDIDRQKATVDVEADIDNLKRSLKEAEKQVEDYDKRIDKAKNERSKAQLERYRDEKRAAADVFRQNIKYQQDQLRATKQQQRADVVSERRLAAIQKREEQIDRIRQQAERRRAAASRETQRLADREERQRTREIRDEERLAALRQKELDSIPRMQREYVALAQKIERLGDARRKLNRRGDDLARVKVEFDEREAIYAFERLRDRLRHHDAVVDIPVRFDRGHQLGETMRVEIGRNRNLLGIASGVGAAIATDMGRGFTRRFRGVMDRGIRGTLADTAMRGVAAGARGMSRVGGMLSNLSNMTIRLGPFTATIRQALVALSLLGPVLVSIVGALGALVSVTGAATLGVGALALGFLGGLIPAVGGFFAVIKPVAAQFGEVMKASKAYRTEVLKSGKNSEEAKDKLKALDQVLGNVDKQTRRNFIEAGKLSDRWSELTKPARAAAFRTIGDGLNFASKNMGWFAKNTNQGMKAAEDGIRGILKNLDTGAFDEMGDNFNKAIRPMLAGIGNLLNYFARVGQVASRSFPGLARTFRSWSKGILDTTNNTSEFEQKIRRVVQAAKDMGNFFMSAGRLMKAFFGAGLGAGTDLLKSMTNAMNEWTSSIQKDPSGVKRFFESSVDGIRDLWHFLQPVLAMFVRWSVMMEPFASGFFAVTGAVAKFVDALMRVTLLRAPLTALATTLGALWAVNRIGAAVGAISNFTRALLGLKAAQTGLAGANILGALTGAGRVGTGAALTGMGADIALMGRQAETTAAKAGGLRGALSVLGRGAIAAAPTLLRLGTVAGLAGTAAVLFGGDSRNAADDARDLAKGAAEAADSMESASKASSGAYNNLAGSVSSAKTAHQGVADAQREVDRLTVAGKTHTDAYRAALQQLNSALHESTAANKQRRDAMEAVRNVNRALNTDTVDVAEAIDTQSDAFKNLEDASGWIDIRDFKEEFGDDIAPYELSAKKLMEYGDKLPIIEGREDDFADAMDGARKSQEALTDAREAENTKLRQNIVNAANLQRGLKEFAALAPRAGQVMLDLARQIGGAKTMQIAIKFPNPRQALSVMKAINNAIDSGVSKKRAINIAINSKTATEALRKLDRITLDDKKLRIVEQGGEKAVAMVERLIGKKLPQKVQDIIEKGGPNVVRALQKILGVKLPRKTQDINESGGSSVLAKLGFLRGFDIGRAIKYISESGGGGVLGFLNRLIGITNLGTAVKTIVSRGGALGIAGIGGASGARSGIPGDVPATVARRQAQLSMRNNLPVMGSGTTARGAHVRKPTLMVGEENRGEYVIATNPQYRKSNIEYLRMAARELGVTMAAKGYNPKAPNKTKSGPEGLKPVRRYRALQKAEDDASREISIAESRVQEPDSFIKEAGLNEYGEMTYAIDQAKLNTYTDQLTKVSDEYNDLTDPKNGIVARMLRTAGAAYNALKGYRQDRRENAEFWDAEARKQNNIAEKKLPKEGKTKESRARRAAAERKRQRAEKRRDDAKEQARKQRDKISDAQDTEKDIREDEHDLRYREQEYKIAHKDVAEQITDADPRAQAELGGASPSPPDQGTAAEQSIGKLEAERALAEAGMGLGGPGTTPRAMEDILKELIGAQESRIGEAQGMLKDANPYNDEEAYSILAGAGSAITSLKDSLAGGSGSGSGTSLPEQMYTYSQARGDLFRSFGSNFSNISSWNAGSLFGSSFGRNPYATPGTASALGGTTVNISNTFPTPPADPHIWSQGIAYELGTL